MTLTNQQIYDGFIGTLSAHGLKLPPGDGFIPGLARNLAPFSMETLMLAAQEVIRTWKFQRFPSVPECVAYCRKFEAVGVDAAGASSKGFAKQALGMIQASGGTGVSLSPFRSADRPDWDAWLAYFSMTGNTLWRVKMESTAARMFSATNEMTFPCRSPRDFDENAPTAVREAMNRHRIDRAEAAALCDCPLGQRALENGWLSTLVEWVENRGRLPQEDELPSIRDLVADRRESVKAATEVLGPRIQKWRHEFERKAAREVFGLELAEDGGETFGPADAVARAVSLEQQRSDAAMRRAEEAGKSFRDEAPQLSEAARALLLKPRRGDR